MLTRSSDRKSDHCERSECPDKCPEHSDQKSERPDKCPELTDQKSERGETKHAWWSAQEFTELSVVVSILRKGRHIPWIPISQVFDRFSPEQCKEKWKRYRRFGPKTHGSALWTVKEDALIKKLRSQGLKWKEIAGHFPKRSINALMARFHVIREDHIRSYTHWSGKENELFLELMTKCGMVYRGKTFAQHFKGRSECSLLNHFYRMKTWFLS
jgi:hypothetical protein